MKFKTGDIVEAYGVRGKVVEITYGIMYSVLVELNIDGGPYFIRFTDDGKEQSWHQTPNLSLIERPKKKVKKTIEGWTILSSLDLYSTKEGVERYSNSNEVIVKIVGEYEVEE